SRRLPVEDNDPINEKILAISEDKIEGFVREPFQEIAERSGVDADVVMARIAAMLRAGTIRRVRQTLLATNLADGALVAWKVPEKKIDAAFEFMFQRDPFSGHVVLRSTDTLTAGSEYKLWTTVKVPHGFSLQDHCRLLAGKAGAERFRIMPAKGIFTLGVGHVRRKTIEPGSRAELPAKMIEVRAVELSEREWKVLLALKREFAPEETRPTPWAARSGGIIFSRIVTGGKAGRSFATLTSWRSRTAPIERASWNTKRLSMRISLRKMFRYPTPMFFGVVVAKSSPRKFRRCFTGNGWAR